MSPLGPKGALVCVPGRTEHVHSSVCRHTPAETSWWCCSRSQDLSSFRWLQLVGLLGERAPSGLTSSPSSSSRQQARRGRLIASLMEGIPWNQFKKLLQPFPETCYMSGEAPQTQSTSSPAKLRPPRCTWRRVWAGGLAPSRSRSSSGSVRLCPTLSTRAPTSHPFSLNKWTAAFITLTGCCEQAVP